MLLNTWRRFRNVWARRKHSFAKTRAPVRPRLELLEDRRVPATLYGPTPYLSFNDSPLGDFRFSFFHLEDFEDGSFNVPGVNATTTTGGAIDTGVVAPSPFTDSIDADDGIIDGSGASDPARGFSFFHSVETQGMRFTFDPGVLGAFPSAAGVVWTDGRDSPHTVVFEAFDGNGVSLGAVNAAEIGDTSFQSTTGEDRFFGVYAEEGISAIQIYALDSPNGMEIDHLQYGLVNLTLPGLSISDATVIEGDSGTTEAVFTVTLSEATNEVVTADFATADGSATAGVDYAGGSGTITFAPGQLSQTISVAVNGDIDDEATEDFFVRLSNLNNASCLDDEGLGTIQNDDTTLLIDGVTVVEGNGGTTQAVFNVRLSVASVLPVSADLSTQDGSASAGSDYTAATGSVSFDPGATTGQSFSVTVNGDTAFEPDESFFVIVSSALNVRFTNPAATGTITNDDVVAADPPTVETQINGGGEQRSMVNKIVVTFNTIVDIDRGAIRVRNIDTGERVDLRIRVRTQVEDGHTVAVVRFDGDDVVAGSLPDGHYRLVILSDRVHDAATGLALDGDGDGLAGGDHRERFFRLFGDGNGDDRVNRADLAMFNKALGKKKKDHGFRWFFDYDVNDRIDRHDQREFLRRFHA